MRVRLSCTCILAFSLVLAAAPRADEAKPPAAPANAVDAQFNDNSALKMVLLDSSIELTTEFGKLTIPVKEIVRIEFGLRITPKIAIEIDDAIAKLGADDFDTRETASAKLLALREKAYPAVLKATQSTVAEVRRRAREIRDELDGLLSKELRELPEYDTVHTSKSKIAGYVEGKSFKARTTQFGEVDLQLADVRMLVFRGSKPAFDPKNVLPGPTTLHNHQMQIGKVFYFEVVGQVGGSLWGTEIYTLDSSLPAAVVHMGYIQQGEKGVVKVTILPPMNAFVGSTNNGVTSSAYGPYPGAYKVEKP